MQDKKAYENHLKQQYGNNITTSVTTNNWKVRKIMTGALITLPLSKQSKLFLQPKLLTGFCKIKIPDYRYIGFDQNGFPLPDNLARSENDPDGGILLPGRRCIKIFAFKKNIFITGC